MTTVTTEPTRSRSERHWLASVGLHLALSLAAVIAVFPPLWLLVTSFKPRNDAFTTGLVTHFTLDNYTHVLTGTAFLTWFGNSVVIVGLTTLIGVFTAATTGYAVSRFRFDSRHQLVVAQPFRAAGCPWQA